MIYLYKADSSITQLMMPIRWVEVPRLYQPNIEGYVTVRLT